MYLADTQPGANGLYYDVDADGFPELLIAHQFLDGSGGVQLFAVQDEEVSAVLNLDNLRGDIPFSSDAYVSLNVVENGAATQIMALKTDFYPGEVDEEYGQTYWDFAEFWLYDYVGGTLTQRDHWSYTLHELEDGRFFEEDSRILRNGSPASVEALDAVMESISAVRTVSLFDDTDGVPLEWLLAAAQGKFVDVPADEYFAEPVQWAAKHGVTVGTSDYTFSPGSPCTRGQIVTFLWRAANCPEPKRTDHPVRDVRESDYFCKAVLWAMEQGITVGTSPVTFSPNDPCTRAQVVTLLHRAAGTPAVTAENPFADVQPGEYYHQAVLWAVKNGITQGTSATAFSPDDTCTRGQIVTFLYRAQV